MPQMPPKHRPAGWKPVPKAVNPNHKFYGTQEWKRTRAFVRERDHWSCQIPTSGASRCGRWAYRVDHIKPREEGGSDLPFNLRCVCDSCDGKRHREKGFAWRA